MLQRELSRGFLLPSQLMSLSMVFAGSVGGRGRFLRVCSVCGNIPHLGCGVAVRLGHIRLDSVAEDIHAPGCNPGDVGVIPTGASIFRRSFNW